LVIIKCNTKITMETTEQRQTWKTMTDSLFALWTKNIVEVKRTKYFEGYSNLFEYLAKVGEWQEIHHLTRAGAPLPGASIYAVPLSQPFPVKNK